MDDVVEEGRLSGSGDAADAYKPVKGHVKGKVFEVMLRGVMEMEAGVCFSLEATRQEAVNGTATTP